MNPFCIPLPLVILQLLVAHRTAAAAGVKGLRETGRNVQDRPGCAAGRTHPCERECRNSEPMDCNYVLNVEWYLTLSKACFDCPQKKEDCYSMDCVMGNGVKSAIQVYNRSVPGPLINVCKGDNLNIKIRNQLSSDSTTVHWHGILQEGTPHMDGVPFVTQCPINTGSSFTYSFPVPIPGTYFYHSHQGVQRGNGLFGPLVVRDAEDPHANLYDEDLPCHVITVIDWFDVVMEDVYMGLAHENDGAVPTSILINGLGFNKFTNLTRQAPIARFVVEKDKKYRFRLISAGVRDCPIEISIDKHKMKVISTDGYNTNQTMVDSITLSTGERYDFVLNAAQKENNYWIRAKGSVDCETNQIFQVAILQYQGASETDLPSGNVPNYETAGPAKKNPLRLNPMGLGEETSGILTSSQLRASSPLEEDLKTEPDYKFFLHMDFTNISDPTYNVEPYYGIDKLKYSKWMHLPQINWITHTNAEVPLLMDKDNSEGFCNGTSMADRNCEKEYCSCPHVLQIDLNKTVEFILSDGGFTLPAAHPFHLHGMHFRLLGMRKVAEIVTAKQIRDLDEAGELARNFDNPPIKDTVMVPQGGYAVGRFRAVNPGFWFFHCHVDFHAELGMALVFKVGTGSEIPDVPANFPTCPSFP